ncbi:hypothetical protein Y032_0035g3036 [Ancylostoma ceylanicum]|uniref:L-Fucosyltransferase n=1 Tax=Ancylostoma ceylanicum TaxID=53326 RepID=A0A016UM18_9BILA|nr:hypothetical protein Y032_0035g3036 [Ancylostoma ceylanicum]
MRKRQAIRCLLVVSVVILIFCMILLTRLTMISSESVTMRAARTNVLSQTKVFPQGGGDVTLDQPWQIPQPKVIYDISYFDNSQQNYLVSNFSYSKGLGNLMFQYASLKAIANSRNASLVVPLSNTLRRAFDLNATFVSDKVAEQLLKKTANATFETNACCSFVKIPAPTGERISAVLGYMQNPLYFTPDSEPLVRKEFTFLEAVQKQALNFMNSLSARRALQRARPLWITGKPGDEAFEMEPDALSDDLFYVGVHVRRGIDIEMNERNRKHGHVAAPADYYKRAMALAKGDRENVVFVVCSDNIAWAKKNLPSYEKGTVFHCPGKYREVDMAILAQCDALVLSTGTFSWWTGFLNQKASKIVYYADWPRPGSDLMKMVNKTEFFPSSWTPLS